MLNKVQGFLVEVTVKDAIPQVCVSFADGRQVIKGDALSIRRLGTDVHGVCRAQDGIQRAGHLLAVTA